MKPVEVLNIFKSSGALLEGHFKLSSGLHSSQYLQCALVLQHPKYAERLCSALARKFAKDNVNVVVGPALGGVVVSYETARAIGCRSIFTERKGGKMELRRGFELGEKDNVLVVEDVVTTGGSTKEVIEIIKKTGAHIAGVGSIVDRSRGAAGFGVKYESLFAMDIPAFKPKACPLCRDKVPVAKPGSRV